MHVRAAYTSIETAAVMNAKPPNTKKGVESEKPKNKMIIRTPARPDTTAARREAAKVRRNIDVR